MKTHVGEVHEVVWIIIEDQEIIFTRDAIDLLPSLYWHNRTSWVSPSGVYVHDLGHLKARGFALLKPLAQACRTHAVVVLIDSDHLCIVRSDLIEGHIIGV